MKAAALNLLWSAHRARLDNHLAEAHRDLTTAVDLCRTAGDQADLSFALKRLGQVERDLGHLDAALAHYEEAAAIHRARGDAVNLAHTIRHLGDIQQDAGRPARAAVCFEEALQLYRSTRSIRRGDLANAVRSLAIHQERAGETERARRLWAEARELYASLDGPLRRLFRRGPNPGVLESSEHLARLAQR
jgi:tetratricopeptide (TPR) repeat protein